MGGIILKGKTGVLYLLILFLTIVAGVLSIIAYKTYKDSKNVAVFKDLKNYIEISQNSMNEEPFNTISSEIADIILDNTTVKLIKADKEKCTLEITSPDCGLICQRIMDSSNNWDRSDFIASKTYFLQTLKSELESRTFEYLTSNIELEVVKNGNRYEIIETEEYMDAMYGGLLSYYNELSSKLTDEEGGK